MQENIKYILEIYKGSSELHKLIIQDSLNDLYLGTRKLEKVTKQAPNLESVYVQKLTQNFITEMKEDFTPEKQAKFGKYINGMVEKGKSSFSDFGLFNITKEKVIFSRTKTGQAIREYYGNIGNEDLEEIQNLRKIFIDNLLIKEVIGVFEVEDPIFYEAITELIQTTSKKGKKGKREMLDISQMPDKYTRTQFSLIRSWIGNEQLKKAYSYFLNDMNFAGYSFNLSDIEFLYKKICNKRIITPIAEIEHTKGFLFIRYKGEELSFKEGEKPYFLLSEIFKIKNKKGIDMWDLFELVYKEEYMGGSDNQKEMKSLRNSISGINKRFRGISGNNNLLQIKKGTLIKLK